MRLDGSGRLEAAFPGQGGADNSVNSVVWQPGRGFVVGGLFASFAGTPRSRLARVDPTGKLDAGFVTGADDSVQALAVDGEGRLLVGGWFQELGGVPRRNLGRLLADGSVDPQFQIGTGMTGVADSKVNCLAVLPDGRILAGGYFTRVNGQPRTHLVRLLPSGAVDPGFQANLDVSGTGLLAGVYALAAQPDGRVMVGGDFTGVDGLSRVNLARLNADGSVDRAFDPGVGFDALVSAVAVQADGRIWVGGFFNRVNGEERNYLARLLPAGSLDRSVDLGTGPDDSVQALMLQPDGALVVGGAFRQFSGLPRGGVARWLPGSGPGEPRLVNPLVKESGFQVFVQTEVGRSYWLESQDDLGGVWKRVGGVAGDGLLRQFTDPNVAAPVRLYRVAVE